MRKLRIVLVDAQKAYVLNASLGVLNPERRLWMLRTSNIHIFDDYVIVQCVILNDLSRRQKRFERHRTYEMFQELKLGFQARAHVKRYETSDKILCLQSKGEMLNS